MTFAWTTRTALRKNAAGCLLAASALIALTSHAQAQNCPSPAVANGGQCTVPSASTLTVSPAGAIGIDALNGGQITANGIAENLAAATTTGVLAESGGRITFDGSTLTTTATTTATSAGQIGFRATGSGSLIEATGSFITMGPPNGTTTASNMTGAIAEAGNSISLTNTFFQMLGGTNGLTNRGVVASGIGSAVVMSGGGVSTASRGSISVTAEGGGLINIANGTQISTTGAQNTVGPVGSHGLFATGIGSQIVGNDISVSTSGLLASGARAENGGQIFLTGSAINTSSTASADADPSSAVRALSGGFIELRNSTISATGQRGNGISVQDVDSFANVVDTSISVSGTRAPAALIFNGGKAEFTNSSLFSANNTGVLVQDTGSTIKLTDSTIRSTGAVGYGLRVNAGGSAEMSGGSVTTEGRDGPAFAATNGAIVANNVTIVTRGPDNAMGALADLGGNITLNGGSVTTFGDSVRLSAYPHGLAARNPGGILTANGTSVLTQGLIAMGAVADDGGTTILNGNSIRTLGTSSIGLYATVEQAGVQFPATLNGSGISVETFGAGAHGAVSVQHFLVAPSVITLDNSSVTTHGDLSAGLRAITAGTVNASRTSVLTEGVGSNGLHARDVGSSVNINATSVLASGNVGNGAVAEGGGLLTGINSVVRATGTNAMGLYVAGAPGQVSNANFTGSSITNIDGPTIGVGGNGNVTLTNSFVSGSGQWLRVGTIANFSPLAAPDSGPPGITDPEGTEIPIIFPPPAALPVVPGLANVTLSRTTVIGSAFTAPGSVSNVTLLDNSTWIMTGSSNVTNLVNDPSLIQFTPPTGDASLLSSYKTLTTVNYVGINGIIGLNTYLGNDSAPSDRLVIDGGTATGLSPLRIANTIGRGDLTRGNGILVIDAINGGTTAPGTFILAGPVSAGPYDYTLHRSSIVDASNPDDWYLRSRINCALEPTNPACAQPTPDPANYRPETSLYAAIPSMALLYGRSLLDTLHERVGEEEDQRNRPNPENGKLGWARIVGVTGHQNGDRLGIFGSGPKYNYSFGGLQGGMDVYRHDEPDGSRDQAGVYFAIGTDRGRVTHISGVQGDSNFDAYSLGGYWTHFGPQGWYTDTILQGTFYDVNSSAHRGLATLNTNGQGLAASVEAGHPFRFADGYFIEPQVQMIYQSIAFANASDGAALVRFENADSLLGRIGARFGRTWSIDGGPRSVTAWIRPNLWNEFRGNPITSFSSEAGFIPFRADLGGLFGEINIGASGQLSADVTLYANASYQARFDGAGSSYDGKVGMRFNW